MQFNRIKLGCLLMLNTLVLSVFGQHTNDTIELHSTLTSTDSTIFSNRLTSAYLYIKRADNEVEMEDFEGAMNDYNSAIEMKPNEKYQYVKRGDLKERMNDHDGAIEDYTKEIELNPEYWIPYANRGFSERMIGKYYEAIDDYTKAIDLYPDKPYQPYYLCRADAKYNSGDYQGALEDYLFVINYDSFGKNYTEIFIKLGRTQLMLKEYEDAMNSFNQQIQLVPYEGIGYYERAMLNIELGNLKKVCKDLEQAQELKYEFDLSIISSYCK